MDDVADRFTEGVERRGADIAVDDANGREREAPEAAFGVIDGVGGGSVGGERGHRPEMGAMGIKIPCGCAG